MSPDRMCVCVWEQEPLLNGLCCIHSNHTITDLMTLHRILLCWRSTCWVLCVFFTSPGFVPHWRVSHCASVWEKTCPRTDMYVYSLACQPSPPQHMLTYDISHGKWGSVVTNEVFMVLHIANQIAWVESRAYYNCMCGALSLHHHFWPSSKPDQILLPHERCYTLPQGTCSLITHSSYTYFSQHRMSVCSPLDVIHACEPTRMNWCLNL